MEVDVASVLSCDTASCLYLPRLIYVSRPLSLFVMTPAQRSTTFRPSLSLPSLCIKVTVNSLKLFLLEHVGSTLDHCFRVIA